MHKNVKYWILPDIENRICNGEVTAHFETIVREIRERSVLLETHGRSFEIANDFVFALTGYHPDYDFLRSLGIQITGNDCRPYCNTESLESNIAGIYLAGVIVAGARTSEIFIENGRFHGRQIAADLARKLASQTVSS
jgi:bacillithiol disulfide reductase